MKYFLISVFFIFQSVSFAQTKSTGASASPKTPDSLPPVITSSKAAVNPTGAKSLPRSFDVQPQEIDWARFGIATGILAASVTGLHILQNNAWWANQRGPFHIEDDPDYKDNFDKFGHGFGGYYTSHFFYEAYTWTGMDSSQATVLAGICGAMYEFYVEIEDGFAKGWGFSPGDAKADIAGAAFYVLRNRIDFLRNFQYKWFYFPSSQYLHNRPDIPGQALSPLDDYGGQTYWMAVDIHRMLPQDAKQYWPAWLNLAFGIGGWNLDSVDPDPAHAFADRKRAYFIGLDFNLERIIPESNIGIINFIRRGLSYWRFPAPAFRISPDPRFFILFPLQMSIG
ncbi:MAG: DUF2279 domain-containing protein [Bacteroidota bacterium]|nr:DUF2279 domain-containing protein [Bacteroidota bacterium]MDP4229925.1 DUF2279 domain-containing protein [Bacteroidota bacterium]MDP4236072.1 DUF2279 domain-containing protein [Bacteroidota bacterium]